MKEKEKTGAFCNINIRKQNVKKEETLFQERNIEGKRALRRSFLPKKQRRKRSCAPTSYLLLELGGLDADAHLDAIAFPQTSIRGDDRSRGVLGLSLLELRGVGDAADEGSAVDLLDLGVGVDDGGGGVVGDLGGLELSAAIDGAHDSTLTDDLLLSNTIDSVDSGALGLGSRGVLGLSLLELRGVGDAADESSAVDGLDLGLGVDDGGGGVVGDLGGLELSAAIDGAGNGTLLESLLLGDAIHHVDSGARGLGSRGVLGLSLLELRGVGDAADESSAVNGLDLGLGVDDGGGGVLGLGLPQFSALLDIRCNLLHCLSQEQKQL